MRGAVRILAWVPIHGGHAIERVRLTVASPDLGFNETSQVGSQVFDVHLEPGGQPRPVSPELNGWMFRRRAGEAVVEELGIRDGDFGYVSTQYDRWDGMRERLKRILVPAVEVALGVTDAGALKLEYWDSFVFEGTREDARASDLLSVRPAFVPDAAYDGPESWHSHIGWFERMRENRLLINQNVDTVDLLGKDDDVERKALNIYTLTEQRFENWKLEAGNFWETVDFPHARSVRIFAASITEA